TTCQNLGWSIGAIGRDNRRAASQRLDDRVAEPFIDRGRDEQARALEPGKGIVDVAGKEYPLRQTEIAGERLERGSLGTLPDEADPPGLAGSDQGHRAQEQLLVLFRR